MQISANISKTYRQLLALIEQKRPKIKLLYKGRQGKREVVKK